MSKKRIGIIKELEKEILEEEDIASNEKKDYGKIKAKNPEDLANKILNKRYENVDEEGIDSIEAKSPEELASEILDEIKENNSNNEPTM